MSDTKKYDPLVKRLDTDGGGVRVPHDPDTAAQLLAFDVEQARAAEARAAARGVAPRPAGVPEFAAGVVPPTE